MTISSPRPIGIFVMLLSLSMTIACSSDDTKNTTVQPTEKALITVVHASPDAPGVNLFVDSSQVNTAPLTFPNATGYLELPAGDRNIMVKPDGSNDAVIAATLTLEAGKSYSVYAINAVSSIEPLVLVDDLTPPASGKAHVRFLHLSPDAPAVDIRVKNGPVLWSNRTFKDSDTAFTPVDAGRYDLEVVAAGTDTVVLDLPGIQLSDGAIYTVFAKGFLATLGAEILVNRQP
ncbi:MAG: DUF4397 domain-containing protein [Myxococcales bacterium]|nr:DUF4397 domain-containing protein [Myxococcales bacterium]